MPQVNYPPQNPEEYSFHEKYAWGMIPVRICVLRRADGWKAYLLLKHMAYEWCIYNGVGTDEPTPFERVRQVGDTMPKEVAEELFPEMAEIPYAY